jgi:UDP-glucose 4-epimerase
VLYLFAASLRGFMRVLITGGAGFIGSHLAERILARGDTVAVVDDLSTGSFGNIEPLAGHPKFRFVHDSITNHSLMSDLLNDADMVYHLAAAVGVRLIIENPSRAIETNIRGTEVVLSLAAEKRKRVLMTSTSEVYGKREAVPFREDDDLLLGPPTKARWSYACSKAIGEFLAIAYWNEKRAPTVIARMFNVIGPRQTGRYGMVVPTLVKQALAGEDLTVHGDGSQRRCFLDVNDAVTALIQLAGHDQAHGQVYNIGSVEEISVLSLARLIQQMTGSQSRIVLVPYPTAFDGGFEDMMRRVPDITKISRLIGFSGQKPLEAVLRDVIEYHRRMITPSVARGNPRTISAVAGRA